MRDGGCGKFSRLVLTTLGTVFAFGAGSIGRGWANHNQPRRCRSRRSRECAMVAAGISQPGAHDSRHRVRLRSGATGGRVGSTDNHRRAVTALGPNAPRGRGNSHSLVLTTLGTVFAFDWGSGRLGLGQPTIARRCSHGARLRMRDGGAGNFTAWCSRLGTVRLRIRSPGG